MVMSPVHQVWPKTILQGTVKGERRQGRQRKRWEDNIREWTGLEFAKVPEGSGEQGKMEKTGYEIMCGAPTTLTLKGETIMMMMRSKHPMVVMVVKVIVPKPKHPIAITSK